MSERVYTTVNVSKLCKVSLRTVIRWVDEGKLRSFRTPGGHRRVREDDLMQFLNEYRIPFSVDPESAPKKILILDQKKKMEGMLKQLLRRSSDVYEITQAKDLFESAIRVGLHRPDLLIVAADLKAQEIREFLSALKRVPDTKRTRLLILGNVSGPGKKEDLLDGTSHVLMDPPVTPENLRPRLLEMLGDLPRTASG